MTKMPPITEAKPVAPKSVPLLDAGLWRLKLAAVRRSTGRTLLSGHQRILQLGHRQRS